MYKISVFLKEKTSGKFGPDGVGWLLLQQIIIAPLSLVTTMLLTKILSVPDYGYYRYVLSVITIFSMFSIMGTNTIAQLNLQKGQEEFFLTALEYRKILRWIPTVLILLLASYYYVRHNNFLAAVFALCSLFYLFVEAYNFYPVLLSGKGYFRLNSILDIAHYFVSFVPPIVIAYFFRNSNQVVIYIFITLFLFQFLFRYISFKILFKRFFPKNKDTKPLSFKDIQNFRKQSLSVTLTGGLNTFFSNANNVVVFNRLGAVDNAAYSLATTFANFASSFISAPMGKILFILSQMTKEGKTDVEKKQYIFGLYKKYFLISLGIFFCTVLITPFIYIYLFPKYYSYLPLALIYSFILLASFLLPASSYFLEKRHFYTLNAVQTISGILSLIAGFIAALYCGVLGVIFVQVLISFINGLTLSFLLYNDDKNYTILR